MSTLLAIDPGNTESGWVVIDADTRRPLNYAKTENSELHRAIRAGNFFDCEFVVIEMIASYGMSVGAEVFETCVWIGRFHEAVQVARPGVVVELVKRQPVRIHHCHSSKARDSNVAQALVDRFAPGQRNHGKGTKAEPGWFYGFRADVWQAYALAVYAADTSKAAPGEPTGAHVTLMATEAV